MPMADVNGIAINYEVEGRGDPLVLIMGFSADRASWMFQTPAFGKRHRVVTFDNRGIGKSGKPKGPYSTRMMAEDTVALMDRLGIEKAHILGISMGGMIAQEIAITYPERVLKLVLASTYACRDGASNGPTPEMNQALELPIKEFTNRLRSIASNDWVMRAILGPLMRLQLRFMGESGAMGLSGQKEACLGHDASTRLQSIQAQTLVMTGTGDRVIRPSSSELLADRIPRARLVRFDGASHLFCMEQSGGFNAEVLGFLAKG